MGGHHVFHHCVKTDTLLGNTVTDGTSDHWAISSLNLFHDGMKARHFPEFFFSNFATSALCLRGGEQSSKSDDELYKVGCMMQQSANKVTLDLTNLKC